MANPVSAGSGTHDPAGTTEESVTQENEVCTYVAVVSLENMAAGDIATLRIYQTLLATGARVLREQIILTDAQILDVWQSKPVPNINTTDADAFELTIECNDATVLFPWTVFKYT